MDISYSYSQLQTFNRCRYSWWLRSKEKIKKIQIAQPLNLGSAIHAGIASALIAANIVKNTNTARTLLHTLHYLPCTQCSTRTEKGHKHAYGTICVKCYHKLSTGGAATFAPAVAAWSQEQCPGWRAKAKGVDVSDPDLIDLSIVEAVEMSKIVTLAVEILDFHVSTILEQFEVVCHPQTHKPLIEHPFTLDTPYGEFRGVIDAVVLDKTSGIPFVVDFKTTREITNSDVWFDLQTLLYEYWLHASGIDVAGSMIYQIRSSLPKQPALTKKGAMNRTAISTTWEIYKAALIENSLDPADYEGMRLKLLDKKFHQVQKVYRPANQKVGVIEGVLEQLRQMHVATKNTCYRSISRYSCNNCDYSTWCMSEITGNDPKDSLIGSVYTAPAADMKEPHAAAWDELKEKAVHHTDDDTVTCTGKCRSTIKGAYYKVASNPVCPGCKLESEKETS